MNLSACRICSRPCHELDSFLEVLGNKAKLTVGPENLVFTEK